jgi:hypothetical protein
MIQERTSRLHEYPKGWKQSTKLIEGGAEKQCISVEEAF